MGNDSSKSNDPNAKGADGQIEKGQTSDRSHIHRQEADKQNVSTINSFGAKFQTFFVCFSFLNKLSLEQKFIRKVERLNVKQRRSR